MYDGEWMRFAANAGRVVPLALVQGCCKRSAIRGCCGSVERFRAASVDAIDH